MDVLLHQTHPVRLEQLSWEAIAELQRQGTDMLLLPLGATEQHGPHLSIRTDTVIAERACWGASALTGVPVLPALAYGVSSGHTNRWPGTFSLTHETFIATLCEIAEWCVATGWRRLLLVNSHFGNDASMRVAVQKIRLKHLGTLRVGACNTFRLSDVIWNAFTADAADLHANKAETDLMLHLAPEEVWMNRAVDDPDRTVGKVFSYPVSETSLNGVTGSPSVATPADGEKLFAAMVRELAGIVGRANVESAPLEGLEPEGRIL